jgi:hypothetical protein
MKSNGSLALLMIAIQNCQCNFENLGWETLQMEEILEFSNRKYCCGKSYESNTIPNLTILFQLQRLCKLVSSHKLIICKNLESGRTGLQLFGFLLRNSTGQTQERKANGQYTCNMMTWRVLLLIVAVEEQKFIPFQFFCPN